MHDVVKKMLEKYNCVSEKDYVNALKEIFQEIALLGLWRAKFFEHAAFYGGSALRILYGLDRFSEDLDFTLLNPNTAFNITYYNKPIADELHSFGFSVEVLTKNKNNKTNIESAFIKADTKKQFLVIEAPKELAMRIHHMQSIKIKMEVDVNPPGKFSTEVKPLLHPIPFFVKTLTQSDLFAGKVHAILCRPWQKRVKGRDWYDFVWYIANNIPIHLTHLKERLVQSSAWEKQTELTKKDVIELLNNKINKTDFDSAKNDVIPFLRDRASVAVWSKEFFQHLLKQVKIM